MLRVFSELSKYNQMIEQNDLRLLALEKRRRNIPLKKLVFVGMHNLAQYWWCAQSSVLRSRRNEIEFFLTYLYDRVKYSFIFGHLKIMPKNLRDLLDIGSDLKYEDIDRFEKYQPPRWSFEKMGYVIVGIPDGITQKYVYEKKDIQKESLLHFEKPVAFTQADLYGYFFKRDKKIVEIYIEENNKIMKLKEDVDTNRAKNTIRKFKRVDNGAQAIPPQKFKCNNCEFKRDCRK